MPTLFLDNCKEKELKDAPDYFRTLDELRSYSNSPKIVNKHKRSKILFQPTASTSNLQSKLVVCHDYQGGYNEKFNEAGYSFNWWHLTSCFIYFAHHRISCPPTDWIRTAHRNGTKILGTLIFEGGNPYSTDSVLSMILGDSIPLYEGMPFSIAAFDTTFADTLVDLALERGFEGWLINVEVGLLGGRETGELLKQWVSYLTSETERRIVGGEIMWYDGATIEGNSNSWQNKLSPSNEPFFEASSSIFLNYFWNQNYLKETTERVDKLVGRNRNEVCVGIDVFGRGMMDRIGGFDCFRGIDYIMEASERAVNSVSISSTALSSTTANQSSQLSIALFAVGWVVESENLQHTLKTKTGYQKWFNDELYFWIGGLETDNVKKEQVRIEKERKLERGLVRARELARSCATSIQTPIQDFDYNSPLPTLPGAYRSISSYFSSPRAPPSPCSNFYTNFSNGSGFSFFFEGVQVFEASNGWTNIDFSFPSPSLFYYSPVESVSIELHREDSWIGSNSLKVKSTFGSKQNLEIPLCPILLPISNFNSSEYQVVIIWKALIGDANLGIHLGSDKGIKLNHSVTVEMKSGWSKTLAYVSSSTINQINNITSIGITLSSTSSSSSESVILIGSLSISPSYNILLPQPLVSNLDYNSVEKSITWDSIHSRALATNSSLSLMNLAPTPRLSPLPAFEFYLIFELNSNNISRRGKFLGITSATEFGVREFSGRGVIVVGVRRDGESVEGVELNYS